jgi:hypothetical protein
MRAPRRFVALAFAVALLALAAGPVAARDSVDPNTLNPPPPDFFHAVCSASGRQTICTLAFSDPDIVDEPSGIVCGGVELLFSQSRSVVGKRYYDADGNLNQRHFRESFVGTFTDPESGLVADWIQHDTVIHDLSIPGDASSGTTHVSGLLGRVTAGGRTVLTATGTFIVVEGTGETIRSAGKHPFDDYFTGVDPDALAPICEALAG